MEIPYANSILDYFPPDEGSINQYSGPIGSGKTYAATKDILDILMRGRVVYANWRINFMGYDQRTDRFSLFLRILGFPIPFKVIPKENFHYVPPEDWTVDFISELNDCHLFIDEGHNLFNSYEKTNVDIKKLVMVYSTRHYNREINIISQRQTAIHVSARANVNRFYRLEQHSFFGLFRWFQKDEYQELTNDERIDLESDPVSTKRYFPKKYIFQMYDTKYLRLTEGSSQKNLALVFFISFRDAIRRFFGKK